MMKKIGLGFLAIFLSLVFCLSINAAQARQQHPLWQVYEQSFKSAKYVDLTHTITPAIPVWSGFGPSKFQPTINPKMRSDWSKEWPNPELAKRTRFPGVSLAALQFLHLQRKILFHGHEPLDTDSMPTLEGEAWLLRNGYAQAEGVANLDKVPETGALVAIGYPKFKGGLGGYARYIAICPPDWKYGVSVGQIPESPMPKADKPLRWDTKLGVRVR